MSQYGRNKRVFSWASGERDCSFLISVCSTAHVGVEGPGQNLGRFSSEVGGGGEGDEPAGADGAGFACQDSLCSEEGLTDCTLCSLIMR